ncbi:hypothetical protein Fmac_025188 [Flemingia macrophylla]|uniref:AP2/ERF domain-containing protein n=1 Tax=Flemingia macrophylla TaxID=520843 RepID=A0ABD1LRH3_9FABA
MKRSPASSCSSSSSSVGIETPIQSEKRRPKHPRRNLKQQKCNQDQTNGGRSSIYRGVTRHRWTGRFEAHLWDKSSWNNIQSKKGRQVVIVIFSDLVLFLVIFVIVTFANTFGAGLVYLGAYDTEEAAARTYDLAALKYWGKDATLNFTMENYSKDLQEMDKVSKEEYLASLRRQSSGFSRGISKYRGVARHHHNGRWEARIGRCPQSPANMSVKKTQEEAAVAYDKAAIEYRGLNAVTNFDISNYIGKIKKKNDQTEPQTAPNSSDSEEAEVEQYTTATPSENLQMPPQHQYQVAHTGEEPSMATMMDHVLDQDLPWSLVYTGLSELEQPHLGFCGKADDLAGMFFDGSSFDEDIDFLFSTEPGGTESDINMRKVLDGIECGDTNGAGGRTMVGSDHDNKHKMSPFASSSPSSTTSGGWG